MADMIVKILRKHGKIERMKRKQTPFTKPYNLFNINSRNGSSSSSNKTTTTTAIIIITTKIIMHFRFAR